MYAAAIDAKHQPVQYHCRINFASDVNESQVRILRDQHAEKGKESTRYCRTFLALQCEKWLGKDARQNIFFTICKVASEIGKYYFCRCAFYNIAGGVCSFTVYIKELILLLFCHNIKGS